MFYFGNTSQQRLDTCHEDLRTICNEVIKSFDFSIIEGHRTLEQQQLYFNRGQSKLDGINRKSKHQYFPSLAVDIAPYPIKWSGQKNIARFYMLAGYMFQASEKLYRQGKIDNKLRWGGDWNGNKKFTDQSFDDLPHFELKAH